MKRQFHYHPSRQREVGDALILGKLVATAEQLHSNALMPLHGRDGEPTLGYWMDVYEPQDWLLPMHPFDRFESALL